MLHAPEMLDGVAPSFLLEQLAGCQFQQSARHGKYLFIQLSRGPWLVLHFGMTGGLVFARGQRRAPISTQLLISFADGSCLSYHSQRKLGTIGLTPELDDFLRLKRLGPDALHPRLTAVRLAQLFKGTRRSVKSALLNQHLLAGIGNLYADEILFQAGIHPLARTGSLKASHLRHLSYAVTHVLNLAIARRADPGRMPATWLLPRRPQGQCPRCHRCLGRFTIAGRTTYSCDHCQRRGAFPRSTLIHHARPRARTRPRKGRRS